MICIYHTKTSTGTDREPTIYFTKAKVTKPPGAVLKTVLNQSCFYFVLEESRPGTSTKRRHKISIMSTDSQFDNVVNNTDMTEIDNQGKLHFNPRFFVYHPNTE